LLYAREEYLKKTLFMSPVIWAFAIFCIFAGNITASKDLGEMSVYSLFIGTFVFGLGLRFVVSLAPAVVLRKLFIKHQYKFNEWGLLIVCMFVYMIYMFSILALFYDKPPAGTTRLGLADILTVYIWTYIINYGKEKRKNAENGDKVDSNPGKDITQEVISTMRLFAALPYSYRFVDFGDDVECRERLDGQWVTTGVYTKSTKAIRPVEITKDTMILLSNLYWYFRKIERK